MAKKNVFSDEGKKLFDGYWYEREKDNINKNIITDDFYEKKLRRLQNQTADKIQKDIDAFYGKYASETGMTIEDARKTVDAVDVSKFAKKAKKYMKTKNLSKRANEEMRLYNLTMKTNRLELLKAQINKNLVEATEKEGNIITERLTKGAIEEFERQSGILGMTVGSNVSDAKFKTLINGSVQVANWNEILWNNQDSLRRELEGLISNGIVQGINPRVLARELRKKFKSSIANSERLMRTEMAKTQGDVFKESMNEAEFDEYVFIAQPTGACNICSPLDGEVFDKNSPVAYGGVIGVNFPPIHPNCRCATAMYYNREKWEREMRRLGYFSDKELLDRERASMGLPPTLSDEMERAVQIKAKEIQGKDIEHFAVFDRYSVPEGRVLWTNTGNSNSVSITGAMNKGYLKDNVTIHNHPNDSSFSIADMKAMMAHGTEQTIVVGRNSGTIYKMSSTRGGVDEANKIAIDFQHNLHDMQGLQKVMRDKHRAIFNDNDMYNYEAYHENWVSMVEKGHDIQYERIETPEFVQYKKDKIINAQKARDEIAQKEYEKAKAEKEKSEAFLEKLGKRIEDHEKKMRNK